MILKIQNLRYSFFGIIFLTAFFAILVLIPLLIIGGGLWLSKILHPLLSLISIITIVICIFILLPLALFRKTRWISRLGLLIASYVFGATLWTWSFLLAYTLWGFIGLFIGLCIAGVWVVPIALLATIFSGEWILFGQLVLLMIFTFGCRVLALRFIAKKENQRIYVTNIN